MDNEPQKWKELSRKRVYENPYRNIEEVEFELPDGKKKKFSLLDEHSGTSVLALTQDNRVILTREFRPGPQKTFYELPGGIIDEGEDAIASARRELLEETGYEAKKMEFITDVYLHAYSSNKSSVLVATGCEKVADQNTDEGEFIEVVLKPVDELRVMLASGGMRNIEAIYLGLDHLGLLESRKP